MSFAVVLMLGAPPSAQLMAPEPGAPNQKPRLELGTCEFCWKSNVYASAVGTFT